VEGDFSEVQVWVGSRHFHRSTHCALHSGASNGSAKYHLSHHIFPSRNSMICTTSNTRPLP
jgi:hypothetical protein